ncbi:uncharacterized protein LOC131008328 [Salvia miltiorrhiza]|uniref:uncharacterized protein LOC131008328 n=1 Tax=Salvia miltiorrhiza TaxID=226208 RepID=UPI0025AB60BE|nr:uncharacterized protein LOC131008328 [Salvia miltiorrhiza]
MWLLHPGFHEVVANSWNIDMETHCPIYRVMSKLRRLCGELRTWNKDVFGHVDIQIADHQRHLLSVQNNISVMGYSDELFDEEVGAQAALNSILARKHSLLQQKCRAHWLTDGDRNTEFFHRLLRFRKNNLRLEHLRIGDTVSYDQNVIQQHIVDFFSNLFKDDLQHQVDVTMLEANIDHYVTDDHNAALIRIPDDEEIHAAGDVLKAVKGFFINSYLPTGCNANILILILKKETVDTVADLRPIILSNFFFKIISKILATRLNKVAAEHVSPNQFGFIGGRSIHDCIILGSEGLSSMNRIGRKSNMACKIDIRKAFDTMSWDFILKVLGVNGFHEKFVHWISIIFCSARISILYNGQLSGYFPCSRGVRQGDPLSPILFGIADDVLSHILLNCVRSHHLIPLDFSQASHFPTHLFYADDIQIFRKASLRNAHKIKEILDFYGGLSGQICSSQKSNVSQAMQRSIVRELEFGMGSLPVNYLGVPLFSGRMKASYLRPIYDKIIQKFSRWKGLHLSMAGRICLCYDWLGYKLVDKLGIPDYMHMYLNQAVDDYYYDGIWHFTEDFVIRFPDVVVDMLVLPIGEEEDARF